MPMRDARHLTCHIQAPGQVGKGEAIHYRHLQTCNAHVAVTMAPRVCGLQLWHYKSAHCVGDPIPRVHHQPSQEACKHAKTS